MKKRMTWLMVAAFLSLPHMIQKSFATKQEGNIIYISGQKWRMHAEPILGDTVLFHKMEALLPSDRVRTTANVWGYTSYWSIHQNQLHLDSIYTAKYDKATQKHHYECMPEKEMHRVFADYVKNDSIIATWCTRGLRIVRGKCLSYQLSFYEEEMMLTIEKGHITEKKTYHNSLTDGYSLEGKRGLEVLKIIKEKKLLHIEKYPELKGVKQIIFSIKHVTVDKLGHITNCTITAKINRNDEWETHSAIAEEMKQAFMSLYPWRILHIYGAYLPDGIEGYTFRYIP